MKKTSGLPWWAWVPFLPVLLALLLIWRNRQLRARVWSHRKTAVPRPVDIHRDSIPLPADSPYRPEPQDDDLVIIKGIGLKSAAALKSAGIRTFAQLAAASPDRLRTILLEADLRLPNPATWPDQAAELARGI